MDNINFESKPVKAKALSVKQIWWWGNYSNLSNNNSQINQIKQIKNKKTASKLITVLCLVATILSLLVHASATDKIYGAILVDAASMTEYGIHQDATYEVSINETEYDEYSTLRKYSTAPTFEYYGYDNFLCRIKFNGSYDVQMTQKVVPYKDIGKNETYDNKFEYLKQFTDSLQTGDIISISYTVGARGTDWIRVLSPVIAEKEENSDWATLKFSYELLENTLDESETDGRYSTSPDSSYVSLAGWLKFNYKERPDSDCYTQVSVPVDSSYYYGGHRIDLSNKSIPKPTLQGYTLEWSTSDVVLT